MRDLVGKLFKMVRMQSLVATFLPFALGIAFVYYHYFSFNLVTTIVLFLICCLMQMIVNLRDSISDYHVSKRDKVAQNTDEAFMKVSHKTSLRMFELLNWSLIIIGILLAVWLVIMTNWMILALGLVSAVIGYFYTGGPKPIQDGPFGEIASGLTMGYIITLATVLVNLPTDLYNWNILWQTFLVAGIAICGIADIMLANNICDVNADKKVGRHTIVYYLGKPKSFYLYIGYYVFGYLTLIASVLLSLMPWQMLIVLLTIPFVWHNTRLFMKKQVKSETFILTIMNDNYLLLAAMIGLVWYMLVSLF